jgi:hypothetical protein
MALEDVPAHRLAMKDLNFFRNTKSVGTPQSPSTEPSRQTRMPTEHSKDEIARRAYFIYLDRGCPQGEDVQHWFEAEAQALMARGTGRETTSARARRAS